MTKTAAMVLIGDELLSGRTKDLNLSHLAEVLGAVGIDLKEARIVSDEMDAIGDAVNALRVLYDYVFTTGGIGPTHDDITIDAVAAALGLPVVIHPEAEQKLLTHFEKRGLEPTEGRMRMARVPEGAELIQNELTIAPGVKIENVHMMAGVPKIFQTMLDAILPSLETGAPLKSETVTCLVGEGDVAEPLGKIVDAHPDVMIGSYPFFKNPSKGGWGTHLVLRARDESALQAAVEDVKVLVTRVQKAAGIED
jgi:molybdenum cofactor synthesis domain-containing protein